MNKTNRIFQHEIYSLVSRFSFWFGLLGVPLIAFLIYAGINWINRSQGNGEGAPNPIAGIGEVFEQPEDNRPQGFVDPGGLIRSYPGGSLPEDLIAYADEESAQFDLDSGRISAYYLIPPDYLSNGRLNVYVKEFSLMNSGGQSWRLHNILTYNLLDEDLELLEFVQSPIQDLDFVNLSPETGPVRDRDSGLTFFLPYGVMMIFFMAIMGSAGLMLSSITKEKENRVMEVLLLSVTPHQLLMGKITGLGLVGLLQIAVWGVSAFALLRLSGQTFQIPPEFMLDPSILAWGLIFFILGYLIYAALLAGVGALVPSLKEASQATMVITLPMMAPLFIISALIDAPNGPLATGFSLFPFTAPSTMMLRLAAGTVPVWQILLSIGLLILTVLLVIRSVAGMFRAQMIMSGQPLTLKRLLLAMVGRA